MSAWLMSLHCIFLALWTSLSCPHGHWLLCSHLQAFALSNHYEPGNLHHLDCSCMDSIFYTFYGSDYPGLEIALLWIQFDWSLLLWYAVLLKLACMDNHVMNLLVAFNSGFICTRSFINLITSYIVILHSQGRREEKSSLHLLFPHHCSCLIFWTMYIYLFPSPDHVPHGQDGDGMLHDWNPLPQSAHLHTEECRSETCHEKGMACQNYLRKRKMNGGPCLIIYWVMVWLSVQTYESTCLLWEWYILS